MRDPYNIAMAIVFCLVASQEVTTGQDVTSARAGLVNYLDGTVYVDSGRLQVTPAHHPILKENQNLRTDSGRVEILLTPDVFLRLGESGRLRMQTNALDDVQVAVEQGSALIEVAELIKGSRIRVRSGNSVTEFLSCGLYRLEADRGELRVYGGEAEVMSEGPGGSGRSVKATRGTSVDLKTDLKLSKFDLKAQDSLHLWAGKRSADLFSANPVARKKQMRWVLMEADPRGIIWNPDYDMKVRSAYALMDFNRRQNLAALAAASTKSTTDKLAPRD